MLPMFFWLVRVGGEGFARLGSKAPIRTTTRQSIVLSLRSGKGGRIRMGNVLTIGEATVLAKINSTKTESGAVTLLIS